jgi:hypothetical protein
MDPSRQLTMVTQLTIVFHAHPAATQRTVLVTSFTAHDTRSDTTARELQSKHALIAEQETFETAAHNTAYMRARKVC